MNTGAEPHDDADGERGIAALLAPAHAHAQFEALWVRIAAEDVGKARPRPAARRPMSSFAALAATLLIGAGIGWYQRASAPSYTTLGESARQTCRPGPMQVVDGASAGSAFIEARPRVDRSAAYGSTTERANALRTPELW